MEAHWYKTGDIRMPLDDPLNKDTHCASGSTHTERPFPLFDALGKFNIYKNVMAWQPSIKLVITKPIQRRDRILRMMSAWWGVKGARRHVNSCSQIVYRTSNMFLSCYQNHKVECCARTLTGLIDVTHINRWLPYAGFKDMMLIQRTAKALWSETQQMLCQPPHSSFISLSLFHIAL